jgi:hypothetical protein
MSKNRRGSVVAEGKGETDALTDVQTSTLQAIAKTMGAELLACDAHMLLSFVRGYAKEKEPEKATAEKLRACLQWRKEFGTDTYLEKDFKGKREEFRAKWPHGMHGVGKEGHIVYFEQPCKGTFAINATRAAAAV